MHNLNKYAYTYCHTCTWSCTGGCDTQCDNAWLKEIEPEEVRTEAANIADLDRGALKWSWL